MADKIYILEQVYINKILKFIWKELYSDTKQPLDGLDSLDEAAEYAYTFLHTAYNGDDRRWRTLDRRSGKDRRDRYSSIPDRRRAEHGRRTLDQINKFRKK